MNEVLPERPDLIVRFMVVMKYRTWNLEMLVLTCLVTSKGPNFIDMPPVFVDVMMFLCGRRAVDAIDLVTRTADRNIVCRETAIATSTALRNIGAGTRRRVWN